MKKYAYEFKGKMIIDSSNSIATDANGSFKK